MKQNFESLSDKIFNAFDQHQISDPQQVSGGAGGDNGPAAIWITCNPSTNCNHFDMDTYNAETKSVRDDMDSETGTDC